MLGWYMAFELQGLPKMTNTLRVHWVVKHREAKKWKKAVKDMVMFPPKAPLKKARVTITRCSSKEPDFDGLVSAGKHILDGLVEAGILVNDKPSVIGQPTYAWEYAGPKKGRIKVRVEELP